MVDVVGENIVTTCDTCAKEQHPAPACCPAAQEAGSVTTNLATLVDGQHAPDACQPESVGAPGIAITRQVIRRSGHAGSEQNLVISRLVSEISIARTVEKALLARRLLLTGRQVPEVYATEVAREHADASIAELDREIDSLLFETRVRREVVSETVGVLLRRATARRQASLAVPAVRTLDPRPLERGRVP